MLNQLKNFLGIGPRTDFEKLIREGAQLIDVRTKEEFRSGHIKGSMNIPLHELAKNLVKINKSKPVIVCCASGVRSGSARNLLEASGYSVYNGGGWLSLQRKIAHVYGS